MKLFGDRSSAFLASVIAVVAVSVLIIILTVVTTANKLSFSATFYFVCYSVEDNAISASSISDAVASYGGAGYALEYGDKYYITVSCYYKKGDAEKVCESLKRRNLECEVLKIETGDYPLPASADKNLYLGNLNTLFSLSTLAYECANNLDTGEYGQINAKSVVTDVKSGLKGLLSANADNCFSPILRRLIGICGETDSGIIYSKDLRKLQIAIADGIINVDLR